MRLIDGRAGKNDENYIKNISLSRENVSKLFWMLKWTIAKREVDWRDDSFERNFFLSILSFEG